MVTSRSAQNQSSRSRSRRMITRLSERATPGLRRNRWLTEVNGDFTDR